jgi:hypothetical protein
LNSIVKQVTFYHKVLFPFARKPIKKGWTTMQKELNKFNSLEEKFNNLINKIDSLAVRMNIATGAWQQIINRLEMLEKRMNEEKRQVKEEEIIK